MAETHFFTVGEMTGLANRSKAQVRYALSKAGIKPDVTLGNPEISGYSSRVLNFVLWAFQDSDAFDAEFAWIAQFVKKGHDIGELSRDDITELLAARATDDEDHARRCQVRRNAQRPD